MTAADSNEIFTVKAYAMDMGEDGAIQLSEADMVDGRPEYWGGFVDCESNTLYVGLDFKCDSEKIASVELSTDTGFFARQYIGDIAEKQAAGQPVTLDYAGSQRTGYKLFMTSAEFDVMGDTISFDRASLDEHLFFWAMSYVDGEDGFDNESAQFNFPQQLSFRAKATLVNGKIVERQVAIDLPAGGNISVSSSEEQVAEFKRKQAAFNKLAASISLDECEVAPNGVRQLSYGDSYEYLTRGHGETASLSITEEQMSQLLDIDEPSLFKLCAYLPGDGGDGHIVNIAHNGDGTFTGVTYIVPGELIMRHYEEETMTCVVYVQPRLMPDGDPRIPVLPPIE